ncbi:hypothetical protein BH11PAT3_BH11PAT3_0430 [soil metagenome]
MAYEVAILNADVGPGAERYNNLILGPMTMGIEVTKPSLAERCRLGNHDPQHSLRGHSSAIEESMKCEIPPDGARLVTIKKDKDSLGTMAVWIVRLDGDDSFIDRRIVGWIGLIDRCGYANAKQQSSSLALVNRVHKYIKAMDVIVHQNPTHLTLASQVSHVARILTHDMPQDEIFYYASLCTPIIQRDFSKDAEWYNPIPILYVKTDGELRHARSWASNKAPVVIIHASKSNGWNIVWREDVRFDHVKFVTEINQIEALSRNMKVQELINEGLAGGCGPTMWITPSGRGRGTKILNMKETLLKLVYSCYTELPKSA